MTIFNVLKRTIMIVLVLETQMAYQFKFITYFDGIGNQPPSAQPNPFTNKWVGKASHNQPYKSTNGLLRRDTIKSRNSNQAPYQYT